MDLDNQLSRVTNVLLQMQKTLECTLCLDMLSNPVSTPCGHHFCSECIFNVVKGLKGTGLCPLCLAQLTRRSLYKNEKINEYVNGVQNIIASIKKDCGIEVMPTKYRPQLLQSLESNEDDDSKCQPRIKRKCISLNYSVGNISSLTTRSKSENRENIAGVTFKKGKVTQLMKLPSSELSGFNDDSKCSKINRYLERKANARRSLILSKKNDITLALQLEKQGVNSSDRIQDNDQVNIDLGITTSSDFCSEAKEALPSEKVSRWLNENELDVYSASNLLRDSNSNIKLSLEKNKNDSAVSDFKKNADIKESSPISFLRNSNTFGQSSLKSIDSIQNLDTAKRGRGRHRGSMKRTSRSNSSLISYKSRKNVLTKSCSDLKSQLRSHESVIVQTLDDKIPCSHEAINESGENCASKHIEVLTSDEKFELLLKNNVFSKNSEKPDSVKQGASSSEMLSEKCDKPTIKNNNLSSESKNRETCQELEVCNENFISKGSIVLKDKCSTSPNQNYAKANVIDSSVSNPKKRSLQGNVRFASDIKVEVQKVRRSVSKIHVKDAKSPGWSHVTRAKKDLKSKSSKLEICNENKVSEIVVNASLLNTHSPVDTDVDIDENSDNDLNILSQKTKDKVVKLKEIISRVNDKDKVAFEQSSKLEVIPLSDTVTAGVTKILDNNIPCSIFSFGNPDDSKMMVCEQSEISNCLKVNQNSDENINCKINEECKIWSIGNVELCANSKVNIECGGQRKNKLQDLPEDSQYGIAVNTENDGNRDISSAKIKRNVCSFKVCGRLCNDRHVKTSSNDCISGKLSCHEIPCFIYHGLVSYMKLLISNSDDLSVHDDRMFSSKLVLSSEELGHRNMIPDETELCRHNQSSGKVSPNLVLAPEKLGHANMISNETELCKCNHSTKYKFPGVNSEINTCVKTTVESDVVAKGINVLHKGDFSFQHTEQVTTSSLSPVIPLSEKFQEIPSSCNESVKNYDAINATNINKEFDIEKSNNELGRSDGDKVYELETQIIPDIESESIDENILNTMDVVPDSYPSLCDLPPNSSVQSLINKKNELIKNTLKDINTKHVIVDDALKIHDNDVAFETIKSFNAEISDDENEKENVAFLANSSTVNSVVKPKNNNCHNIIDSSVCQSPLHISKCDEMKECRKEKLCHFKMLKRYKRIRKMESDSSSGDSDNDKETKKLKSQPVDSLKVDSPKKITPLDSEEIRAFKEIDKKIFEYFRTHGDVTYDLSDDECSEIPGTNEGINVDNLSSSKTNRKPGNSSQCSVEILSPALSQDNKTASQLPLRKSSARNLFRRCEESLNADVFESNFVSDVSKKSCLRKDKVASKKISDESFDKSIDLPVNMQESENEDIDNVSHSSTYSSQSEIISTQKKIKAQDEVASINMKVKELKAQLLSLEKSSAGTASKISNKKVEVDSGEESDELFSSILPTVPNISSSQCLESKDKSGINEEERSENMKSKSLKSNVVICTGLTRDEVVKVKEMISMLGSQSDSFELAWSTSVTHVVVKPEHSNMADRTLKYLYGIASGCWIISLKWVTDSIAAGKYLPEEKYEVLDCSGEPGPKRSRAKPFVLLKEFECCLLPPFTDITVNQFKDLVTICGGRACGLSEFSSSEDTVKVVVIDSECKEWDFQNLQSKTDKVILAYEWLIECIAMYKIISIQDFVLGTYTSEIVKYSNAMHLIV